MMFRVLFQQTKKQINKQKKHFLREFSHKNIRQKPPEMLSPTHCCSHVFKISQLAPQKKKRRFFETALHAVSIDELIRGQTF